MLGGTGARTSARMARHRYSTTRSAPQGRLQTAGWRSRQRWTTADYI